MGNNGERNEASRMKIIDNLGINCPNCGYVVTYKKDKLSEYHVSPKGDKVRWDDELYASCYNKDCKLEFLIDTTLSPEEQKLVDYTLAPFHKIWWRVDLHIGGGSLSERTASGADFLLHHLKGGSVWVEFKRHNKFSFTASQHHRFKTSIDNEAVATRFIGFITVQKKGYKDFNNHIHYWTPAFYRLIPDENFVLEKSREKEKFKPKFTLNLSGLEKCIQKNVYTLQRNSGESLFPLKPIEKDEIIQTPNFSLFNVIKGSLFRKGEYENISNEVAFKIIAMKLRQTVINRAEDIVWQKTRPYISCEKVKITREKLHPLLKPKIKSIVQESYRPLFPIEITNVISNLHEFSDFFIEGDDGTKYIKERERYIPLRMIIKLTMEIMLREGVIERVKAKNDKNYQYYTKGNIVIPLKMPSSRYLDYLRKYILIKLEQLSDSSTIIRPQTIQRIKSFFPISNPELAEFLQVDYNSLRGTFEKPNRDELLLNGLITISKKMTDYSRGQRPSVMAEFTWLIHLTDKGIDYLMKGL